MTDKTYANWKSWRPADFGTPTDASRAYFKKLWRQFVGHSRQPQNILEIGYGNGQFLGWCRQQGHRVTGVETNKDLLTRARKAGFDSQPSIDEVADAGFDLIVLFDVLEHVPEAGLPAYFQMLRDRLLTGGQIILRTPNGGSPLGLNNQHGDPTHVAILTRNKLKYLARDAGLRIHYCGQDIYPLYVGRLRSWPGRVLRRLLGQVAETFVRFVFAPLPSGVLSANLLTVLRVAELSGEDI